MWLEFILAAGVAILLLYGPGYLFFRGLSLPRILALACAPLYGICCYGALPVVYYEVGIGSSPVTVLLPTLLLAVCVFLLSYWRGWLKKPRFSLEPQEPIRIGDKRIPFDVAIPIGYVVVAMLVCVCVLVLNLPQADAFYPRFDNQTHLNLIRAFMDSGKWSSLHGGLYLASPQTARPFPGDGGFYPAAWHCVVALVNLLSGVRLTVGVNAVVSVLAVVVFPLSAYVFMRTLFARERIAVFFGAITITGFASWPWLFVISGPLYPNQMGLSTLFAVLALVMLFVREQHKRAVIWRFVVCMLVAFVAQALAHPSTVFTAYVFLAAYGLHVIWHAGLPVDAAASGKSPSKTNPTWDKQKLRRAIKLVCYVVVVVGFWVLCFSIPQLKAVTSYTKGTSGNIVRIMGSMLKLKFSIVPYAQVGIAFLSWFGCLLLLLKKQYRWLILPIAFFAIASVAVYLNDRSAISHWFGGFWYSDGRRLSVNFCLFLIPAAASGASTLFEGGIAKPGVFSRKASASSTSSMGASPPSSGDSRGLKLACRVVLVCAIVVIYLPVRIPKDGDTAPVSQLNAIGEQVAECYGGGEKSVYNSREVDFVSRAMELMPADSLVANYAPDGSVWAYGVNDLNTMFRSHGTKGQTPDVTLIREHLCEYATNKDVQEAVHRTGASYVLLLDKGVSYENGDWVPQFKDKEVKAWAGIGRIDDNTPGFTTVLAEDDDMRLYKID